MKKEANKMSEVQPSPKRNFIAKIFISSDEPRLRAGWRLLLQTLFMIIIAVILQSVLSLFFTPGKNVNLDLLISQVVELATITGSIYIACGYSHGHCHYICDDGFNLCC
jgi:Na+/glutamate symporter